MGRRSPRPGRSRMPTSPPSGGLSDLAIRRPVFTAMVMTALIVLGFFSYRRLPIDQFPAIDLPIVTVQTTYPGASAGTIEREVTRRLEEAFNPVEQVKKITSVSLEGVSQVIVEFALSNPNVPLVRLTALADETIRRRLESVPGVGEVRLSGGLKREVRVYLQPARMEALGVTVPQISAALQQQNIEVPAGRVEQGAQEQLVRVTGRIVDPQQFNNVIITTRAGLTVRLSDVARVDDATEEERWLALGDARRTIGIDLIKGSGANTVAVADGVKQVIGTLQADLPAGTQLQLCLLYTSPSPR